MSVRACPKCRRELPEATLRVLEQGAPCPFCATPLKRTPRRTQPAASAATPSDDEYAAFQVSQTPPVTAQPMDEDSFRWFQVKAAPEGAASVPPASGRAFAASAAAGAAAAAPAPQPPRAAPAPGVTPALARTAFPSWEQRPAPVPAARPAIEKQAAPAVAPAPTPPEARPAPAPPPVEKRPSSLDRPPPQQPVERRPAPTIVGAAPTLVVAKPVEKPVAAKPSLPENAQPVPLPGLPPEPPRAALAMTAVLPSSHASLTLAAPAMGLAGRQGRNLAIAGATAALTVAVAILFMHRSPGGHGAALVGTTTSIAKAQSSPAAAPSAREAPRVAPTIQPLAPDTKTVAVAHPAEAKRPAHPVEEDEQVRAAEVERAAPESATPAAHAAPHASHAEIRSKHKATAHQRRLAKAERHAKHARREKRSARPTQVASRAAPAPGADAEARATYERGNAQLFAGDAAGAVATYRQAVHLAPADPIGYRGLGLAYEQQGETASALRALHKYLKLAPGAPDREIISRRIARLSHK